MANENDAQLTTLYAELKQAQKSRGRARMWGTLLLLCTFLGGAFTVINLFIQFDTKKLQAEVTEQHLPKLQKYAQEELERTVKQRKEKVLQSIKDAANARKPKLQKMVEDELSTVASNMQSTLEHKAQTQVTALFEKASHKALKHFPMKDDKEAGEALVMVEEVAKGAVEEVFKEDIAACDRYIKSIENTVAQKHVAEEIDKMKKNHDLEKKFTSLLLTVMSRPIVEELQEKLPKSQAQGN